MDPAVAAQLMDLCYEAAIDPGGWQTFLSAYARAMNATAANMHSRSIPDQVLHYIFSHGLPDAYLHAYGAYYHMHDVWVEPTAGLSAGTVFTGDALVDPVEYVRSEFYNDFLRPQEIHHVSGLLLSNDTQRRGCVSVFRPANAAPFGDAERALSRLLFPHMRRAHRITEMLGEARSRRDDFRGCLERLSQVVILLYRDRRVAFMNEAAAALVRAAEGLAVRRGRLVGTTPASDAALGAAIRSAFRWYAEPHDPGGGSIVLPRRNGQAPFAALVTPLASSASSAVLVRHRVVAVFVGNPDATPPSLERRLSTTYGLTPAETRLAVGLARGASVAEVAAESHISAGTARVQLKAAFQKMNVHSQAQLVRLIVATFGSLPEDPPAG